MFVLFPATLVPVHPAQSKLSSPVVAVPRLGISSAMKIKQAPYARLYAIEHVQHFVLVGDINAIVSAAL